MTWRYPQPRVVSSLELAALLSRQETVVSLLPENRGNFGANQHIDQPIAAGSLAGGRNAAVGLIGDAAMPPAHDEG